MGPSDKGVQKIARAQAQQIWTPPSQPYSSGNVYWSESTTPATYTTASSNLVKP